VQAILLAAEIKNGQFRALNVGTGNRYSLNQTLALLEKITGRPAQPNYAPARDGDIRDSQADIRLAKALLGYDPRVTFEEGLKRTWEWFSTGERAKTLD
jgi:UDP-glucose 4-epimerase